MNTPDPDPDPDFQITDWNYIMSSVGNAYFSGLNFAETWGCVIQSSNREEFDAAVSATIRLRELAKGQ
jgi:hypothetical protein